MSLLLFYVMGTLPKIFMINENNWIEKKIKETPPKKQKTFFLFSFIKYKSSAIPYETSYLSFWVTITNVSHTNSSTKCVINT